MAKKQIISLENFHIPRWEELPNVDLYMDQILTFINGSLSECINYSDEEDNKKNQILTKTMINNYVKNNILEPPVKKKYSKAQCAKLFVICILKQVFSMNEISNLINIALESTDISHAYNSFCSLFEETVISIFEKKDYLPIDTSNEKRYLLKAVLLSCSYKIYVQNLLKNEDSV